MKFCLLLIALLSFPAWSKWSVSTYNIRNFDNDSNAGKTNLVELRKIIEENKSDVMAFVEVVNVNAFGSLVKRILPEYQIKISSCGGFGEQKLAVVFNPKIFTFVKQVEDLSFSGGANKCGSLRPVFFVSLKKIDTDKNYVFGVAHLKAGGDNRAMSQRWIQYENLKKKSIQFENENLILLGDFNTTGFNLKDEDFVKFNDFMNDSKLRTASEELGCTSYWKGNLSKKEYQPSILDHIVIQEKNFEQVQSINVGSHCARVSCRPSTPSDLGLSFNEVSDHCPIKIEFK